jgi:predicted nucleotidyltransferase
MDRPIESALRASLAAAPRDVLTAYLFGSTARGEAGPTSDLDVAVLLAGDAPPGFASQRLELAGELERRIGRTVDLIVLNAAPVDLVHRVLRDGVLVLDRDPSARIRFEVRARNEYFDLLPFLRRYRRLPERAA